MGKITLPDMKTYYITAVIKAAWYWWRENSQINRAGQRTQNYPYDSITNGFFFKVQK